MKYYFLLILSSAIIFAQDLLLDDLLLEYENSEELYLKTKQESAGHLIVYSRADLDSMQAHTLNDVLKTIRFFNLQMTNIGKTTLVQSGNKEISSIPIKFFLNKHELTSLTLGDSLGQFGNMNLYHIDHIEIYQSGNSIILGSKPAAVVIKMYTKDSYRENGTFMQASLTSQNSSSLQSIVANTFSDYSYLANIDISKNNSNRYDTNTNETNRDNQRAQLYFQFSKQNNYSIEAGLITDKHNMLSGYGLAPIENELKSQNYYLEFKKQFDNDIELRLSTSKENISIINEDANISDLDVELQSAFYNLILEKKIISENNNLLIGTHIQQQEFQTTKYLIDGLAMPELTGPTKLNIYMLYLQNLYNLDKNNLLSISAKVDNYQSDYLNNSSIEKIFRLGYVSIINEDLEFKSFAVHSYTYPLFTQTTYSPNRIVNPELQATTNKRISAELIYTINNTTLSINGGIGKANNAIILSNNKYINNPEDGEANRISLRVDHRFNHNNKLTLEYFQIHKEQYASPGNGAMIQLFNNIKNIDIYNELIYRSGFTDNKGNKISDGYDYSLAISYPYSKDLSIKLKGQNILNKAPAILINGSDIPAIEQQAILSVEYIF